jgi:hypothetical protein
MNTVEDRLRAAMRETAGEVTPQSVPPLHLDRPRGRRRGLAGPAARRRWAAWLTPLAAAASVTAVVAASLAISTTFHGGHRAARGPAGPFAGVPPYYLVLAGRNPSPVAIQRQFAEVRATATGATLARITPPRPYRTFTAAAGAGDGRTFVLAANKWKVVRANGGTFAEAGAAKFFLLRLGAGGRPGRLTPLPVPAMPPGAEISGFALTPGGTKLAVALRGGVNGGPGPEIQVFSLPSGAERVWTWPGGGPITNNAGGEGEVLSWTADGRTLAFQQWVAGNIIHLRLLDTTTPGGSLQAASRLVAQWPGDGATWHYVHGKISNVLFGFSAIITPDGSKIAAATEDLTKHPLSSALAFTEFSATTGKVVKVLGRWPIPGLYPGQTQDVLWTNSSGSTLIVLAHKPGVPAKDPQSTNSAGYGIEFGVLNGNRFTPLPGAPLPGPGPWPVW